MEKLIIFGNGKIADAVAQSVIDSGTFELVAYTVDADYVNGDECNGKPLISFDDVTAKYPPGEHKMFVALGYHDMNALRASRCEAAKAKGYQLVNVIDKGANLYSDLQIGENCFIMNDVSVHPRVKLGNDVFVWSGSVVGHHSTIGDHVWITSGANISGVVNVGHSSFLAINCTIANNVHIGSRCFLGANSLVIKDLEDDRVVFTEASKPIKLNVDQFLKMSKFS